MQDSEDALLCKEEIQNVLNDVIGAGNSLSIIGDENDDDYIDDDDEYIEMLLRKEINSDGVRKQEEESTYVNRGNWIKEARLNAIQYILNTSLSFGFKIQTAYLAVTYLDKFLFRRLIESEKLWAIHLSAMACLSLAAKMEECKVPLLSEFQREDYYFESKVIQRMEILILETLGWRMTIVTPFTFTRYFVSKLCENNQISETLSKIVEIIFATIKNVNLTQDRPSAIAAASTLLIMNQRLTRESLELKISALSSRAFWKNEDIISLYNRMKELNMERFELPSIIMSPDLSPIQLQRTTDETENSSLTTTSGISAKRKRLSFKDEGDENIKMSDSKRPC